MDDRKREKMTEKIYSKPDIYKIEIPLPNNPLKNLNCYVIKTEDKNLILDTGFHMPECLEAMKKGLAELEISLEDGKTELFLTHLHSDHIGLVSDLMPKGTVIYMSRIDYQYLNQKEYWEKTDERFCEEGFPKESIYALRFENPARSYAPDGPFSAVTLEDGDRISIGKYSLYSILTPGHTPGHMCLYLKEKKLMFLGDHVLFDITPNITSWYGVLDSLGDYLESLKKIRCFAIETALPAHRKNDKNVYERIDEILEHHRLRLENIVKIAEEEPGLNATEIASRMHWSMRGKNWAEFPLHQRWFAVGETMSHLDYLKNQGFLKRKKQDGIYRYEKIFFEKNGKG